MPLCKGIAYLTSSYPHTCPRAAHTGFPFCWQHGEKVRDAVAALEANGPDDPNLILQHLTYRSKLFDQNTLKTTVSRKASRALQPLDGNRDGLTIGNMEQLPLEVLYEVWPFPTLSTVEIAVHLSHEKCVESQRACQDIISTSRYLLTPLSL